MDKQTYEYIQKEVERLETALDLEYWQVFYADSILTHDIAEMQKEAMALSKAKVSNTDLYRDIQDKWDEATYNAFHRILSEDQWDKYCKMGAARDKKARDKRAAKKKI